MVSRRPLEASNPYGNWFAHSKAPQGQGWTRRPLSASPDPALALLRGRRVVVVHRVAGVPSVPPAPRRVGAARAARMSVQPFHSTQARCAAQDARPLDPITPSRRCTCSVPRPSARASFSRNRNLTTSGYPLLGADASTRCSVIWANTADMEAPAPRASLLRLYAPASAAATRSRTDADPPLPAP